MKRIPGLLATALIPAFAVYGAVAQSQPQAPLQEKRSDGAAPLASAQGTCEASQTLLRA